MNKLLGAIVVLLSIAVLVFAFLLFSEPDGINAEERDQIWAWLTCEECTDGEWEAVRQIGDRAVPTLTASLYGLSTERELNMERRYAATWAEIPPPKSDSSVFVAQRVSDLGASIQRRAIIGLERLDHLVVLEDYLVSSGSGLRTDVLGELQRIFYSPDGSTGPSGDVVFRGTLGNFQMPWVRRCRKSVGAPRPAEPGVCLSYEDLPFFPAFLVYDDSSFRWYSGSLPEGIYQVYEGSPTPPPPPTQSFLLWVIAGLPADTVKF